LVLLILIIFGVGIGLIVAVIGGISEELSQLVPSIMRPLYFLSGVFFPLEAIPKQFHYYLLWNPMLHGVEQFRIAFIEGYPSANTSLYYVALWAISSLFFGLLLYRSNAVRVMTR
jgi:capsular polysaccharide transport system permease protein